MKTAVEYIDEAYNNMDVLERTDWCSCYSCQRIFTTDKIVECIPEKNNGATAICPYCHVDALLIGVVEASELRHAHDICFGFTEE
ncbi:MAG TPA: hypothetical protein VFM18_24655 [Methanosarcina sp.]|nr:hypothetical protein [Methanosarcina sp.]